MSNTESDITVGEPITITPGVHVDVRAMHGPDWFPLRIDAGRWTSTLYLNRAELHALRLRLDEIDDGFPHPHPTALTENLTDPDHDRAEPSDDWNVKR
jgi:hypothetical protein